MEMLQHDRQISVENRSDHLAILPISSRYSYCIYIEDDATIACDSVSDMSFLIDVLLPFLLDALLMTTYATDKKAGMPNPNPRPWTQIQPSNH